MAEKVDENVVWGWLINGLGGAINMLERAFATETPIPPHRLDELEHAHNRLAALIDRAAGKEPK